MPQLVPNDPRNLLGKVMEVPRGLRGTCKRCGAASVTDGTEKAKAERDRYFNGRFYSSLGWLVFNLPCPTRHCGRKVEYKTNWFVGR